MNHNQIECKKQILNYLMRDFRLEGELPDLNLLQSCLAQMNPGEFAQSLHGQDKEKNPEKKKLNQEISESIQKIFLALGQHFQRNPQASEDALDSLMSYLSKALLITVQKHNLISMN